MLEVVPCETCHRVILHEAIGNSPGDHDPAYHVAQAYHRYITQWGLMRAFFCKSCHHLWPCPTIREFS